MKEKEIILQICILVLLLNLPVSSAYAQSGSTRLEKSGDLISWWSFDEKNEEYVIDKVQQSKDALFGNYEYVDGISGRAIKLDGFRTYIKRDQNNLKNLTGAFTVESWIALASYPWSWSPVIDCSYRQLRGFFFGIGPEGRVGFMAGAGSSWVEAITQNKIPLRKWVHIAAVFEPDNRITVYIFFLLQVNDCLHIMTSVQNLIYQSIEENNLFSFPAHFLNHCPCHEQDLLPTSSRAYRVLPCPLSLF